jgi:serine/threonine-protein kinase
MTMETAPAGGRGGVLRRLAFVVLVAFAMLIAAMVGGYTVLVMTVRGREVVVPNLIRMTPEEARAEASRHDLDVDIAGSRIEPRVGEGRIFEQDPPAGARTRPGHRVRVLVSLGQASLLVPAVTGEPIRKAQLTLEQMGLRVGNVARVASAGGPLDQVLAQRPAAGSRRQNGDAIDLLISTGPPERVYVMPSMKGLTLEQATGVLKDVGIRVGVSRRSSGSASGLVVDQNPREGYPLREHQTVQLVVSQ